MAHWLLKSEPDDWSWAEQVAKGRDGAEWTGIRNFSAQNNLRAMKKGEQAFFYHTGKERAIVGIVRVIAEAHPDSTDSAWPRRRRRRGAKAPTPVSLDRIKADKRLAGMALARLPRLSVQPVRRRVADRLPDGGTRLSHPGRPARCYSARMTSSNSRNSGRPSRPCSRRASLRGEDK